MLASLAKFIQGFSEIPVAEWPNMARIVKAKKFQKGEMLYRQGEESEMIAYVSHGLAFSYYLNEKHEYKVKKFAWEGRISSPYSTLLAGNKICYFSAEALETTKVYYINFSDLQNLYLRHPCWQKLGRRLAEVAIVEREQREYETLCLSLADRYESFLCSHEPILNRVPQYLIASYLGINAASLSRLRARRSRKSSNKKKSNKSDSRL